MALLISYGADVKAANLRRETALHEAASEGHHATLSQLLAAGADLNAPNKYGATALHAAAAEGHAAAAVVLVSAGAAVQLANTYAMTAANLAALRGHARLAMCLEHAGAASPPRPAEIPPTSRPAWQAHDMRQAHDIRQAHGIRQAHDMRLKCDCSKCSLLLQVSFLSPATRTHRQRKSSDAAACSTLASVTERTAGANGRTYARCSARLARRTLLRRRRPPAASLSSSPRSLPLAPSLHLLKFLARGKGKRFLRLRVRVRGAARSRAAGVARCVGLRRCVQVLLVGPAATAKWLRVGEKERGVAREERVAGGDIAWPEQPLESIAPGRVPFVLRPSDGCAAPLLSPKP